MCDVRGVGWKGVGLVDKDLIVDHYVKQTNTSCPLLSTVYEYGHLGDIGSTRVKVFDLLGPQR